MRRSLVKKPHSAIELVDIAPAPRAVQSVSHLLHCISRSSEISGVNIKLNSLSIQFTSCDIVVIVIGTVSRFTLVRETTTSELSCWLKFGLSPSRAAAFKLVVTEVETVERSSSLALINLVNRNNIIFILFSNI